jgi:hypothetical protein
VRAKTHDLASLRTVCRACHLDTLRRSTRSSLADYKARLASGQT